MSDHNESDQADQLQRNEEIPHDLYAARITGSREILAKLMQEFELDVGCRPHPEANPDGTGTLLVYATQERIRELQAAGYNVERGENVSAVGRERQAEVGKGDRFDGGRITPHGLGEKPRCDMNGGAVS
jgi:hypothetical protein